MASFGSLKFAIFDREEKKQFRLLVSSKFSILIIVTQYQAHIRGLNAYDRHKKFLNDYGRVSLIEFLVATDALAIFHV
ncbi:hypothetical protein F3Y22_tig00005459pilonHSYRG00118 [Hibiscus syriacus]|uniref:Uncharacterized protein n=1 Tax=Hibiscus syriacus TaxID=106335 RepID=A0A6A3CDP4_HIBSY|nr:hypothetical protein F3Y22_tig00005459pilonHSYRG00118 [Hibiscus syriacus]